MEDLACGKERFLTHKNLTALWQPPFQSDDGMDKFGLQGEMQVGLCFIKVENKLYSYIFFLTFR